MKANIRAWLLGLSGTILGGCDGGDEKIEPVIPRLKVVQAGEKATGQSRRMSGRLQAANKSPLSFGVAGRVLERSAKSGQRVVEGEVLAKLDSAPLRLALETARTKVTAARAVEREAERVFRRRESLLKGQGASQSEVDEAERQLASATSELNVAKSNLKQAEIDFTRTELIAPFSGQIVETPVDRFQEVAASETIAVIQADGVIEVRLRVPETMIAFVDYGQTVQASLPSLEGFKIVGTVTLIGAAAEEGSGFPVTVRLAKTDADVRPGMTASVTFNFSQYLDGQSAFLVPFSAIAIDSGIAADGGGDPNKTDTKENVSIFVLDPITQIVAMRRVRIGDLRGNQIEVFEGLEAGELVVTAGVSFVRNGMRAMPWTGAEGGLR